MEQETNKGMEIQSAEYDYSQHGNAGLEESPGIAIPQLRIMQPQTHAGLDETDSMRDVSPGMIYNSVTKEGFQTVGIIPVYIRTFWQMFDGPRGKNRRWLGTQLDRPQSAQWVDKVGLQDKAGHVYERQIAIYGAHVQNGIAVAPVVLRCSGTNSKPAMDWLNLLNAPVEAKQGRQAYTPPAYARLFQVSTVKMTNEGITWYVFQVDFKGQWLAPDSDMFRIAAASLPGFRRHAMSVATGKEDVSVSADALDDIPF